MITVMKQVFTGAYSYKFYIVCKTTDRYKTLELLLQIENVALLERLNLRITIMVFMVIMVIS